MARFIGEAKKASEVVRGRQEPTRFATGGKVHQYPKMKTGSGSGLGRLEKARDYGSGKKK